MNLKIGFKKLYRIYAECFVTHFKTKPIKFLSYKPVFRFLYICYEFGVRLGSAMFEERHSKYFGANLAVKTINNIPL